jgi:4-amino-4-deoxy-L-arabinose transferase-like glycosyltransferase
MKGVVSGYVRVGGAWWSRPWLAAGVLLLVCLAVYLPGLASIPVIDRDEARFAQASRQMLESGDWIVPMVQDRPRLNKPPMIYWLQASSAWLFTGGEPARDAIWMYRVPSVMGAIGAVFVTWGLAWRMSGPSVAFLAASLLAVCPLVAFDAHQSRADQWLLFCTTLTLASLYVCWHETHRGRRPGWGWVLAFWVALAAGILTKGPITPLVAALTALALAWVSGSWRWMLGLRPVVGVAVVVAATLPWVWAVASRYGWAEYGRLVYAETLGRAGGSSEGHWGPPGMHAVLLIALFWPGSLTTARAVINAWRDGWPARPEVSVCPWRRRVFARRLGTPTDAFLIAWLLPGWIFFELFGAKLAHYTMPLYPAVAILSARAAVAMASRREVPGLFDTLLWTVIGSALGLFTGLLGLSALNSSDGFAWSGIFGISMGFGALCMMPQIQRRSRQTHADLLRNGRRAMVMVALGIFTFGAWIIPGEESARIMGVVRTIPDWNTRPIASTHRQDSMVFHTRGRVARLNATDLQAWMDANPTGIVVAHRDELATLASDERRQRLPVPSRRHAQPDARPWMVLVPLPPSNTSVPGPTEGPERGRMPGTQ